MTELPSGMLTFLFTDIEQSTPRWEDDPVEMRALLARHDVILSAAVAEYDGVIFKNTGDGVVAVFVSPDRAARAAIAGQRRLQSDDWAGSERLRVRMGIHIGEAVPAGGDYHGRTLNWASRVMDVANGDQIAVSSRAASFFDDFDLVPMGEHQLKGIGTDSISLLSAPELVVDQRPLRARTAPAFNLPLQPHRLIGRDDEIDEISYLLDRHAAVTVVGTGGVGKTHLAIALGHRVATRFADGVVLCDLVPLNDGGSVPDAVAEALGARAQPGMGLTESIVNYLEGRKVLLILDNCEHVAEAVKELGIRILELDGPLIFATSRQPVGFPAEQLFALHPLDADTDGVALFVERASERDRSFRPTDAEIEQIRYLCKRLDGIPLGIEVAAAWVRVLAPAELVARLDDRFKTLRESQAGGRRQTLQDTVRWSYEQLDPTQSLLFDRLSVFAGGFSLQAAERVCSDPEHVAEGAVLELLLALVDKSMVESHRIGGQTRFSLLGTLRQFAHEQLEGSGDDAAFRLAHAEYYAEVAREQEALLITDRESDVWDLLDREWGNLRAAFETLLAVDDVDRGVELVLDLGYFSALSMRFETFTWIDDLLRAAELDDHPDLGSIHGLRALAAYLTVDDAAVPLAEKGLELDPADRFGYCRLALAAVALNNTLADDAGDHLTTDWLEQLRPASAASSRLWAEGMRAFHLCTTGDPTGAAQHAAALQRLATESGSSSALALSHWARGMVATFVSLEQAMDQWDRGLDIARSLRPVHLIVHLITGLQLHFTASRGDLDVVLRRTVDSLEQAREQHYIAGTSHLFGVTAIVACRCDRADVAARLLQTMVAHGHQPRHNARAAVERMLGPGGLEGSETTPLSINEAAVLAIATLNEELDRRTSPPTRSDSIDLDRDDDLDVKA